MSGFFSVMTSEGSDSKRGQCLSVVTSHYPNFLGSMLCFFEPEDLKPLFAVPLQAPD